MPEISVIMPVYRVKHPSILDAAVRSIQNQTCSDWELLICADGAGAQTVRQIKRFAGEDARIRVVQSRRNHGAAAARNACIQRAEGTYLALMDADDIAKPARLEKQAAFLNRHPQYALVGCCAKLFDADGVWGERRVEERPEKQSFLKTLPFIHPSIMIRRSVVQSLRGYLDAPPTRRMEDYELLMRLYADGYRGYNLQEFLFYYREDADSFRKRKYRYRIDESRVRCHGFRRLGILHGNFRYVLKPLAVGLVPNGMLRRLRRKKYGKGHARGGAV